jgi:hypothetical protein
MAQSIRFEELPQSVQAIFSGDRKHCLCRAGQMRDGSERYYVTTTNTGETSVFGYENGRWTHLRSYGYHGTR